MTHYTCLVVDDEPKARVLLMEYVDKIPYLEVAKECKNAFEALTFLQEHQVDLIFLDIKMPQLNGVEFAKTIADGTKIVFTTAFNEHAIEGFNLGVVDYLLKPFSFQRFLIAVQRGLKSKIIPADTHLNSSKEKKEQEITIQITKKKSAVLPLDTVAYVEAFGNYVRIYRDDQTTVLAEETMISMENLLPKDQFIRVHKSYIVHITKVTSFSETSLKINEVDLKIGRLYKKLFLYKIKSQEQ